MKKTLISALLLSSLAPIAACGGVADSEPGKDPPVVAPPADPPPVVTEAPKSCSAPLAELSCGTPTPAPTNAAAIAKFVKDNAVPLRCDDEAGRPPAWDLRPLVDLYGAQKIFMIGEVHGQNEIGIVSALVFETLAKKKLVNVLGFELPMDLEESLENYVKTGKDPVAQNMLDYFAPNFFGAILTQTAREHVKGGGAIRVGAVDVPMQAQFAIAAIQQLAGKLTAQQATVLDTLPTSIGEPPSPEDLAATNAYFDHITQNKTQICTELSATDCDRLVAMNNALWTSTFRSERGGSEEIWFERREELIYFNMRSKMTAAGDRMFLHMGAAHTNKSAFSAGSRMAKEHALTKGQVFSIAPAYGDGSTIWYGQEMDLPGEPQTIVSALTDTPAHPFFVSTTRPSTACVSNPVGEEPEDRVGVGGTRAESYDGYIHYGQLTSERKPEDTKLSREGAAIGSTKLVAFRQQIEAKEQRVLAARRFRH